MGKLFNARNQAMSQMQNISSITIGTVMDTNDPQQMGRLRIMCPSLGDDNTSESSDHLPWATYCSGFGGMVNANMTRGPNAGNTSAGPVAYGMINIPKRGSSVAVACIDGDPYYRIWLGAVFDQGSMSALPHGRFFYQQNPALPGSGTPEGPLNSYQEPIEPLYSNYNRAFGGKSGNFEWRTRGADFSAAGNPPDFTKLSPSAVADETTPTVFTAEDGSTFNVQNGYAKNRLQGFETDNESTVFSWTSPGFHAISMDDRPENCRMRFRTASGTQVILDDTNERIYINTANGANWFEMDFDGNIDMFATTRINLHAESDINLTSDQSVRIQGKKGVYISSGTDVVVNATNNVGLQAGTDIIEAAGGNHSASAGGNLTHQAGGSANLVAGGNVVLNGAQVQFNSQAAASAQAAMSGKLTNRIPQHEPWGRTTTVSDTNQAPKYTYNDPNVGREDAVRGQFWRR